MRSRYWDLSISRSQYVDFEIRVEMRAILILLAISETDNEFHSSLISVLAGSRIKLNYRWRRVSNEREREREQIGTMLVRDCEPFNYFRSGIDRVRLAAKMHTRRSSFLPSCGSFLFLPFLLPSHHRRSSWITSRALDLSSIHVPLVCDRLWERLMNVFIVVRPSSCTEESLEWTFHNASCVAPSSAAHFAVRLARRMIARTRCGNRSRGIPRALRYSIAIFVNVFFCQRKKQNAASSGLAFWSFDSSWRKSCEMDILVNKRIYIPCCLSGVELSSLLYILSNCCLSTQLRY